MDKLKSCESKIKYTTEIAVQYILKESQKELCQTYYICDVCGNYHITTINKSVSIKRIGVYKEYSKNNKNKGRESRKSNSAKSCVCSSIIIPTSEINITETCSCLYPSSEKSTTWRTDCTIL